jgi:CheY-like chemotaxis protein
MHVLVVDDNKGMREIVGAVIKSVGVGQVHHAADGRDALEVLQREPIDCVYLDYEMPHMNGADFISRVRGLDSSKRFTPIIVLTSFSASNKLESARDRGANEFLKKPVTARDLLLRLEAVIERPRPYISVPTYFGPDRRRHERGKNYKGPFRRSTDGEVEVE